MRTADTILSVIHDRGTRGLPLERVYRLLFKRELYLLAYGRIYRNAGATTPGGTPETVDGMSLAKIDRIIEKLRFERYQWTPARRVLIAKPGSTKQRPLSLPTWSDKLLQEVIRLILEAYYDPQFSDHAHGFRPERGCHTALTTIYHTWKATTWFIEGDIAQCFDSLDHEILLAILRERIHDERLLRLIENLLKAGYLDNWTFNKTLSGVPQGSIVSPILSNIYLDRFDQFVETTLLPRYNQGTQRKRNPLYVQTRTRMKYYVRKGAKKQVRALRQHLQRLPSGDPYDPAYRRLRYIRYADDFLLGFVGPRAEAEEIKQQLQQFLRETLKLQLSDAKTLITHGRTEAARFLGYDISTFNDPTKRDKRGHRLTGIVSLCVPYEVVQRACQRYMRHGKAIHRVECVNDTEFSIVRLYQQEYRGLVQYYQLAHNLHWFSRLKHVMEQSLTKTLAHKLRISVKQVYKRYKTTIATAEHTYKGLQVTVERTGKAPLLARWGGVSLRRQVTAILTDSPVRVWNNHTEIVERLLAERCELCTSTQAVEVHHIRALKDLNRAGRAAKPAWVVMMAARQRKTLVVCRRCHDDMHAGWADGSHL